MNYLEKKLREFDDLFDSHWTPNEAPKGSNQAIKSFITQMFTEIVGEIEGMVKETNNFRQAMVDGREDWNTALEQSASKVDALLADISHYKEDNLPTK